MTFYMRGWSRATKLKNVEAVQNRSSRVFFFQNIRNANELRLRSTPSTESHGKTNGTRSKTKDHYRLFRRTQSSGNNEIARLALFRSEPLESEESDPSCFLSCNLTVHSGFFLLLISFVPTTRQEHAGFAE